MVPGSSIRLIGDPPSGLTDSTQFPGSSRSIGHPYVFRQLLPQALSDAGVASECCLMNRLSLLPVDSARRLASYTLSPDESAKKAEARATELINFLVLLMSQPRWIDQKGLWDILPCTRSKTCTCACDLSQAELDLREPAEMARFHLPVLSSNRATTHVSIVTNPRPNSTESH